MIHHGDLFDVLPTVAEASIDAGVTDPPYGIGFMGKEWDSFSPAAAARKQGLRQINKSEVWSEREQRKAVKRAINPNLKGRTVEGTISSSQIEYNRTLEGQRAFQDWTARWATEVLRVLKPGAHLVVCGAPRSFHRMTCGLEDAGFEIRDVLSWLYGQGFPKSLNFEDGRGTALKPGWEPIVLARRPVEGSTTANVERFGTGAINVSACRIGDNEVLSRKGLGENTRLNDDGWKGIGQRPEPSINIGRWPPNVCLDEEAAVLLDEQSGELVSGANPTRRSSDKFRDVYSDFKGQEQCEAARGLDIGGASRFFYVAKPSREERDYGTHHLTARKRDEGRKDGNPGGDNPRNRGLQPRGNFHPTVKPIALMRWLVKLITPPGGTVLDPFTGSGTTGMACRYEHREFIGIEREAEYVSIADARIKAVAPLFGGSEVSA